jgi:hypothetical protein
MPFTAVVCHAPSVQSPVSLDRGSGTVSSKVAQLRSPFRGMTKRSKVMEGFLADPIHGGNRNKAAWKREGSAARRKRRCHANTS